MVFEPMAGGETRRQREETKVAYNLRFYDAAWSRCAVVCPERWPVHRALAPFLAGRVLEIGPGTFPHSDVPDTVSVEVSARACHRLRASGRRCLLGAMESLPLASGTFDTALALDVLEHCGDDRAALAEVARVLRPAGVFLVSVPLHERYWSRMDALSGHTFRYDPHDLLDKLAGAGLRVERARWSRPIRWLKRAFDETQYQFVSRFGVDLAARAKAACFATLPLARLGAPLAPFTGRVPQDASSIVLQCRRV